MGASEVSLEAFQEAVLRRHELGSRGEDEDGKQGMSKPASSGADDFA